VGPEDVVLLDVDETILFKHICGPGAYEVYVSKDVAALRGIVRTARAVLFVTARRFSEVAKANLRADLALLGIHAADDHLLLTGDVYKGRYVRVELAARGLCTAPGWFVDDNGTCVLSVQQHMPHLRCLEFRGRGFDVPVGHEDVGGAGGESVVVPAALPPRHADFIV
jgi:hypothetical protein